jgi:hypothetical protein
MTCQRMAPEKNKNAISGSYPPLANPIGPDAALYISRARLYTGEGFINLPKRYTAFHVKVAND